MTLSTVSRMKSNIIQLQEIFHLMFFFALTKIIDIPWDKVQESVMFATNANQVQVSPREESFGDKSCTL
jgi:hypothetical protein